MFGLHTRAHTLAYRSAPLPLTSSHTPLLRAVALILEFEKFISVNHIRLVDLFETVDKDKGGTIDGEELREFLKLGRAT